MPQILADAEQARQLEGADGPVEVVDESGALIGLCTPIKFPHSPYTREEIEERREEMRQHPERSKTLDEVMAHLDHFASPGAIERADELMEDVTLLRCGP